MAREQEKVHASLDVSVVTGISHPTVSKILKLLVKGKVLQSMRGAKGGYTLLRAPDRITIASVITALEGPISLTECSTTKSGCEQVTSCQMSSNWRRVNQVVHHALESVTLADLMLPDEPSHEVTVSLANLYR